MTRPVDRFFPLFERGRVREDILTAFRFSLRGRIDPETGQELDERTIALVTAPGGRFHTEADALDLVGMAIQQRAITMLGNMRPVGATSSWLREYHGGLQGESKLPATGGSGNVAARANAGVIWQGSTTAGDPFAIRGVDPAVNRYQLLVSATTPANGQLELILKGLDTGPETNLDPDTVITWANPPVGAQPTATVGALGFTGGLPEETDEDFAQRLEDAQRYKQGAGNSGEQRALIRDISNAIEDGYIYACALHAGSTIVSFTAKRTSGGPLARIPNFDQLLAVQDRIVPPGSPETPERAYFLVLPPVSNPTDMELKLSQRKGSSDGWIDPRPWPAAGTGAAFVSAKASAVSFTITTDGGDVPSGVTAPSLMRWNVSTSRWEILAVASVVRIGVTDEYTLTLTGDNDDLAVNDYLSPAMSQIRADALAGSVEGYFDSLGPGEIVEADDLRRSRAARLPEPPARPYAIGQEIVLDVQESLPLTGAVLVSPDPADPAESQPAIPSHPSLGPGLLTLNRLAVYPLS